MLTILDKYITKKFLSTFLFTMMIFTVIAMVIDFSTKVEDFIEEAVPAKEILVDYYLTFIMYMVGQLIPLYTLIAVIFFTSRLAFNSEMISILNAGVSFKRLLRPYLIGASIIAVFHLIAGHIFIPNGNKQRLEFEHTYVWKTNDKGKKSNVHYFIAPGNAVYVKRFSTRTKSVDQFQLERFEDQKLVYYLKADKAEYQEKEDLWRLRNYEIHTFSGEKESLIVGKGETMDTTLNLKPSDFVRFLDQKDMLTTPELINSVARDKFRGAGNTYQFEAEIYRRSAEPLSIIILTLIGVAVAARKVRGGIGLHLLFGVVTGALYIFMIKFSFTFAASNTISPLLGAWIPNIFFGIVAFILLRYAQK